MILSRCRFVLVVIGLCSISFASPAEGEPLQVGFLWHMHQPIYYPYESLITTDANSRYAFSVVDVHNQRFGPYTTWPLDAVQAGLGMSHLGAQVSFSGSLIENLNNLEAAGTNGGMWNLWKTGYNQGISLPTALGNPRLDLVAFGYHHPLLSLLDEDDIRMQIRLHKLIYGQAWNSGAGSPRGMFPTETAFSTRMIPALVAEGIEWILVDNVHFDRASQGYPHTNASNLFAPNVADQINPDPAANGGAWVQLTNLWAPSKVSAPFGYQPHYVQHVDPQTGAISRIIAVPAARYEGNEDGRGGFGAFLYATVMDQYITYNTDPAHPMFVLLHHDGDNFGGGSEAYYHGNFQNMVAWASSAPNYDVTTVQDYLDRFPVDPVDVIHVENGAWVGADNGDPEFKKWLSDPGATGWSPDRNSWAVLTAAKNRVLTAEAVSPVVDMQNVLAGTGSNTEKAWHYLLVSEASDYWFWDGSLPWDNNVTTGCNQAVAFADPVIAGQPDPVSPTVFIPQREPYNPGGFEFAAAPEASDFEVWTFAYDVSGLAGVTLKWRVDLDGVNPLSSIQNETYAGGAEVGPWNDTPMTATPAPPRPGTILAPVYLATRYGAMITGQQDVLIDYYIEAVDGAGNLRKTDIQHVYVGQGDAGGNPGGGVTISPDPAVAGQNVTISYDPSGGPLSGAGSVFLHYGFDQWNPVISPDPAMTWNAAAAVWTITVPVPAGASQLDVVFNDGQGTWDNNGGQDWHFVVTGGAPTPGWVMDGVLDPAATLLSQNNGRSLYAGVRDGLLYVATEDAGEGSDHFVFVVDTPGLMQPAPWAKAGQVAGWNAFLADENDNGFTDWFDASSSTLAATGPNGGMLEGTLNLAEQYGTVPATICLAMGPYPTSDGSALLNASQVPVSQNGNGDIDANEYVCFQTIRKGDVNNDWLVDFSDIAPFVQVLLGSDTNAGHITAADVSDNGLADGGDVADFVQLLTAP